MRRQIIPVLLAIVAAWVVDAHLIAPLRGDPVHSEPTTGMEFVRLPPGAFLMGSSLDEQGRHEDETQHRVRLQGDRYLGRYEVTQEEWARVMAFNPSHHRDCRRCPVENVSYRDIVEFLGRLNRFESGWRYRLPTEAEWEYACRAGSSTPFSTGHDLAPDKANYDTRFPYDGSPASPPRGQTVPVGSFSPNPWGLHDMHGNVWEWCGDWYAPYPGSERVNPGSPASGERRVIRGGSWAFDANSARCALRYTHAPEDKGYSLGFRLLAERIQ